RSAELERSARSHLHGRRGEAEDFFAALQTDEQLERAGTAEHVLDGEPPFDLALPGFVWIAVDRRLGPRVVAPVPFDRRAVVLLVVVGAAGQFGGEDDSLRRRAYRRRGAQVELRAGVLALLVLVVLLRCRRCRNGGQCEARRSDQGS